jgi:hypothetical protein
MTEPFGGEKDGLVPVALRSDGGVTYQASFINIGSTAELQGRNKLIF